MMKSRKKRENYRGFEKMRTEGWIYYNHAMISAAAPNEKPDMCPIENGDIWKRAGGRELLCLRCGQPIGIAALRQTGGM